MNAYADQVPLTLSKEHLDALQVRQAARNARMSRKDALAAWNQDLEETLNRHGVPVLHLAEEVQV